MIISKGAAKKAKARREARKFALSNEIPIELDPNFPKQNEFIEDKSRYLAVQCSRRAGKTNGLAIRFFQTMKKYPKSQCIYLSLTQDSARDIMWPVLQEINEKYKMGCTFTESKLEMRHPNGAKLKLMGADLKNFIKRLKGRKYPGVGIDEAQDFGVHLQSLIDDVLTPSISDYSDGWLALTGTPGPVPQGYFFDVTQKRRYGYSFHAWTLLDNPYMPEPGKFIADLMAKREWDEEHPTLKREWKNLWVLDVEALWIRYNEERNHYDTLPEGKKWNYILGIDIGFKDADALAIMAWSETDPNTYLLEEVITAKQGLTELVEQIQELYSRYPITKAVIDEGGLGKKLAEEMRRRHSIPVQAADKARKQENVELLNDHLRRGKFKAKKDSRFALDSYLIQIDWGKSTPDRIIINKTPHSDIIDSVLYAFKESPAWSNPVEPKPKAPWGTGEWARQEQDRMWKEAVEHFEEQAEMLEIQRNMGFTDEN
jgi:hypothetical protein